jgi:hypothetical protein
MVHDTYDTEILKLQMTVFLDTEVCCDMYEACLDVHDVCVEIKTLFLECRV